MGAVEKLVHRYWVDVLGVLRGPRASSLQSFRSSSSFLHIDSYIKLMYWGCSGDLGHHPCKVSDPYPLSFISIVGNNYAKSAEKANFAILRCGKWALWKNWSIDIGLMYWGGSGDLGHHPCKVSDAHPLSFISIVGKNYAKSAEKANFAILRCGKWALWKN